MIELGKIRLIDVAEAGRKAAALLRQHGEIAVFLGANRQAAVGLHHEFGYQEALSRHADSLVGLYRTTEDLDCPQFIASMIAEDLYVHARQLGAAA